MDLIDKFHQITSKIGDADISMIGSTVTGAINNLRVYGIGHDIPSDTDDHDYDYPEGLNYNNSRFVVAEVVTR